jgi:hypothetical protein
MEELVNYDSSLVVGILGGGSGTTHDAFKLLEDARKHGARVALYGRKINNSEHQLSFVTQLRAIADGQTTAAEACKAYHGELQKLNIKPYRDLKSDMELTTTASSYSGGSVSLSKSASKSAPAVKSTSALPDFKKMSAAEKVAYSRQRLKADLTRSKQ